MTQNNTTTQARNGKSKGFQAVLSPYRSLSPRGFFILMALVSTVCFISGMVFVLNGAWPVTGFFGLDVLIIYVAFKLNYRSGRLYEEVGLTEEHLTIVRVHPSGRKEVYEFNPYWARVKLNEGKDGRTQMVLWHHQQQLAFGKFLTDDERRDFAGALKNALIDIKGGVRI